MRIATFNIWDSNKGMPNRKKMIIKELKSLDADIICLQEVTEETFGNISAGLKEYNYIYSHKIDDEYTSVVILSKYPFEYKESTEYAQIATFKHNEKTYLVANLHLPWDSIIKKEKHIISILQEIKKINTDYAFLAGDFNCTEKSSVHNYLKGETTLNNTEVKPTWEDVAEIYAEISKKTPEVTLDIRNNPRWKGRNAAATSARFDRIYLRDTFPQPTPVLKDFYLFGKEIDIISGYCASDHYGILVDIEF